MRRRDVGLICLLLLLPIARSAQAGSAPRALLGKSVLVFWTEDRVVRRLDEQTPRPLQSSRSLTVYISSSGRIFNRYSASIGIRFGLRTDASDQIAGSADAKRQARFEERSLLVENRFKGGGRQIAITFDDRYASCTAKVINGLAAGETKSIRTSVITKQEYELLSVKTGPATCEIRSGNAFAP